MIKNQSDIRVIFSEWEDPELGGCISYPAVISWQRAECHYGQASVIIDGVARGPAEMPPGALQVPEKILAELRGIGYVCQPLEPAELADYWDEADPFENHWHEEARLIRY